jgi:hypothetical protein
MTPASQNGQLLSRLSVRRQMTISPRVLGAIGLVSGVVALVAARLGRGSWVVPGIAFVVWCLSGWQLFFADARNNRAIRILGYLFLATGLLVAAAVMVKLYLLALGPAWKL